VDDKSRVNFYSRIDANPEKGQVKTFFKSFNSHDRRIPQHLIHIDKNIGSENPCPEAKLGTFEPDSSHQRPSLLLFGIQMEHATAVLDSVVTSFDRADVKNKMRTQ